MFSLAARAPVRLEWEACAWISMFLCFLATLKENSDGGKKESFPHFVPQTAPASPAHLFPDLCRSHVPGTYLHTLLCVLFV